MTVGKKIVSKKKQDAMKRSRHLGQEMDVLPVLRICELLKRKQQGIFRLDPLQLCNTLGPQINTTTEVWARETTQLQRIQIREPLSQLFCQLKFCVSHGPNFFLRFPSTKLLHTLCYIFFFISMHMTSILNFKHTYTLPFHEMHISCHKY